MLIKNCDKTIFAFSDAHGNHHRLQVPEDADIIICAGDAVEDDLKAQPKWHLFGHIHETEGQQFQLGRTICQNISVFNAIS